MKITVQDEASARDDIQRSVFVAYVKPLGEGDVASDFLLAVRELHPDANHVASAWRHAGFAGCDDDGEPKGTAGRPMLTVLERRGLEGVATACVRWFSGVKLGAGGLIRAYGGTVAKALDAAGVREVHARAVVAIDIPFETVDPVIRGLKAREHTIVGDVAYHARGARLVAEIRELDVNAAVEDVLSWSQGRAVLRRA